MPAEGYEAGYIRQLEVIMEAYFFNPYTRLSTRIPTTAA